MPDLINVVTLISFMSSTILMDLTGVIRGVDSVSLIFLSTVSKI